MNSILTEALKTKAVDNWILGLICFLVYTPLVYVRKIEKFAFFHIVADLSIFFGVIVISIYAIIHADKHGFSDDTQLINGKTFLSFIGLAAYTFEGIGIIIPVMETTSRPDLYPTILTIVILLVNVMYVFFGSFNYFVYGADKLSEHPLITSILPAQQPAVIIVM